MKIKIKNNLKWIITILLVIITILMLHSFLLRIFVRWGAAFIQFLAVACIFYAFIGIFPSFKKPIVKLVLTTCLVSLSIFAYYEFNKPKVVRMKEDVMYILPKSDTINKK